MNPTFRARQDWVRLVIFPQTLWFDGKKCHMDVRVIPRDWPGVGPYECVTALRRVAPDWWQAIDRNGRHLVDLTDTGAEKVPLLGETRHWEFGQATFHRLKRVLDPESELHILDVSLDVRRPEVVIQVIV